MIRKAEASVKLQFDPYSKQGSLPYVMFSPCFQAGYYLELTCAWLSITEIQAFFTLSSKAMHLPLFFAKCNQQHLEHTLSCGSSSSRREIIPAAKQDHSQFWTALDMNVPFSSK